MGKIKQFNVKVRTVVGERRRAYFSDTKVKSFVVNTGLSKGKYKKPSAFSFDAINDALESVFRATSTSKFELQDLSAAIPTAPAIITGPPYRPQVLPKVSGSQFEERINCICAMKEYELVSLEELRLSDYFAGRIGPTIIELDSDDSDDEVWIEREDETELLKHRIMGEFQAVDWNKLVALQLHTNVSNGAKVYDSLGIVETSGRTVYAFSAKTVKANLIIKIQVTAPDKCPIIAAGFTSRDPLSLEVSDLPNQASKLLERPDYWQFSVFNIYESRRVIMKLKPDGEVLVMVGEKDYRVFTVDNSKPLWFFVQASGGVGTVYFRHTTSSYIHQKPEKLVKKISGAITGVPITEFGELDNKFKYRAMAEFQAVNHNIMKQLTLHTTYSSGITMYRFLGEIIIYERDRSVFYAFSAEPAEVDQVYKIVAKKSKPATKLHIGFTSRNPANLDLATLPDPAGLGDRPDYWIYTTFDLDKASRIIVKMKNQGEIITMFGEEDWRKFHVDVTSPLWLFMQTGGGVSSVHSYTTVAKFDSKDIEKPRAQPKTSPTPKATPITPKTTLSPTPGPSRSTTSMFTPNVQINTPNITLNTPNTTQKIRSECIICCDGQVNCALVNCGHTCLCYECGMKMKNRRENCPMCRQEILNVIKLFMS